LGLAFEHRGKDERQRQERTRQWVEHVDEQPLAVISTPFKAFPPDCFCSHFILHAPLLAKSRGLWQGFVRFIMSGWQSIHGCLFPS